MSGPRKQGRGVEEAVTQAIELCVMYLYDSVFLLGLASDLQGIQRRVAEGTCNVNYQFRLSFGANQKLNDVIFMWYVNVIIFLEDH